MDHKETDPIPPRSKLGKFKDKGRFLSIGEIKKGLHHLYSFDCLTPKSLTTKYRLSMVWTCTISVEPLSLQDFFFFFNIIDARWQLMSLFPRGKQALARNYARGQLSFCYCVLELTSQLRTEEGSQIYKASTQNIIDILKSTVFKGPDLSNFLQ